MRRQQPELAEVLARATASCCEIQASRNGLPAARYLRGSSPPVTLHSSYDPAREAGQALERFDVAGADYVILLGFGLGYLLDALLERETDPGCRYFVVESDPGILRAAFQSRDLSRPLSSGRVHFAWPPRGPELAEQWRGFFDPVTARKSVYVSHGPSLLLAPDLFKSVVETIQAQTVQIYTDINTLVGRSKEFLDNFLENLPRALASPGVTRCRTAFRDLPAVIVSAGPSLDRNIHELRGCEDRVLIVAADTALKPLRSAGIAPHFVVTGDPGLANYLHLEGAFSPGSWLVAEATAHPRALADFEGRTLVCRFESSSLGAITDLLEAKGSLRAWGSVATMALDFTLLMGCNPIIFVGQDLAYSDGRTYCSGVYFEESWFAAARSPGEWRQQWEALRSGRNVLRVRDVFGREVETSDRLAAYWQWFARELRNRPGVCFVNATEGGILRDDVRILSLREALHRYCRRDLSLRSLVRSRCEQLVPEDTDCPSQLLRTLRGEAEMLRQILKKGLETCRGADDPRTPERLEELKEAIYGARRLAPILDSFNQTGNFTFLRRRAHQTRAQDGPGTGTGILETYLEYFESVRAALEVLTSALERIESIIAGAASATLPTGACETVVRTG